MGTATAIQDAQDFRTDFDGSPRTTAVGPMEIFLGEPAASCDGFPAVGDDFLAFHIVAELGRGAFGRVFLALQTDLADRPVALKVSNQLLDETQTLAQLQHTNIVPIYSAHRKGDMQAVVMPFFGATTLADVLREIQKGGGLPTSGKHFVSTLEIRRSSTRLSDLGASSYHSGEANASHDFRTDLANPVARPTFDLLNRFTFAEAVLWLGARLADGLAHAHDRGVVHRDLKPANVLLADDGRPMILDFNLASDPKRISSARGGTVPYMAPEQLRQSVDRLAPRIDGRADIYALGLILYELLAGRPAYGRPRGAISDVAPKMLIDRAVPPPPLLPLNAAVTPAIEQIIRKCLAADPARRYSTAQELQEDLEQQLSSQPLKHQPEPSLRERLQKWARRHPRASSVGSIGSLATVAMLMLGASIWGYQDELARRDARARSAAFVDNTDAGRDALIRAPDGDDQVQAFEQAKAAVGKYGLPDNANWDRLPAVTNLDAVGQNRLRARMGEELFLISQVALDKAQSPVDLQAALTWNERAGDCYVDADRPGAWYRQRGEMLRRIGDTAEADKADEAAKQRPPKGALDHYLLGVLQYQGGHYSEAANLLEAATKADPTHFWSRLTLGNCRYILGDDDEALGCFNTCVALNPKSHRALANRGLVYLRSGKPIEAEADFTLAIERGNTNPDVVFQRISCLIMQRKNDQAQDEYTRLIGEGTYALRAYVLRADLFARQKKIDEAARDRDAAVRIEPISSADYIQRGRLRKDTEFDAALADFRKAEELNPWSSAALQNQAHVLDEKMKKVAEALVVLDRLIQRHPDRPQALSSRAVLLARLGRVDEALHDAKTCLAKSHLPRVRYQVAGVYALTADRPGHMQVALQLLAGAIREKGSLADLLAKDEDLDGIRNRPEFQKLTDATATIRTLADRPLPKKRVD